MNMRILLLCAACLTLAACSGNYTAEKQYWHFNRAHGAVMRDAQKAAPEQFAAAAEAAKQFIAQHASWPNAASLQFALGAMYGQRGDVAAAVKEYERVFMYFPDQRELGARALFAIGELYERGGDWTKAMDQYQKVMQLYPQSMPGLQLPIYIAKHYQQNNDAAQARIAYDKAIRLYEDLIEQNPFARNISSLQSLYIISYANQGRWTEAAAALERMAAKYPDSEGAPLALYRVAMMYAGPLKQPDKALDTFRRIVSQYPSSKIGKNAQLELGNMSIMQGDVEQAQKEFNTAIDKYQDDASLCAVAQMSIAAALERSKRWDEALAEYRRVLTTYPGTMESLQVPLLIARHYRMANEPDEERAALQEAVSYFHKAATSDGRAAVKAAAWDSLAESYALLGQWNNAIGALDMLREKHPGDPRAELALARLGIFYQEGLKNNKKAGEYYAQFLARYPDHRLAPVIRDLYEKIKA